MSSSADFSSSLRALIQAEVPHLTAVRRDLHAHPELGYEEHRTSKLVQGELARAGVRFVAGLAGGTGVLAHLEGGAPGAPDIPGIPGVPAAGRAAIGLRADMDALPIEEKTGLPYSSRHPGRMHACGHDGHTAILIGAVRVLSQLARRGPLPRPVTFVFQPAEEGGGGGERMVRDGCLSGQLIGPPVERMFGLHGWPELTVGHAATRIGPMLAAADEIEITVRGMGAHAAYPHYGRDPVLAGAAMVSALQQIASRNVSPLDAVVVSITQFHAGTAHNIIPMTAELNGTVRTLLPQTRALAEERIGHISRSIAQAHGCEAEVAYEHGYPVTRNDAGAAEMFFRVAREALGEARVSELPRPEMGAEDFAYYGEHVPACFFALGVRPVGSTTIPQLHHPAFNFNDDAIAIGVELFCRLALQV